MFQWIAQNIGSIAVFLVVSGIVAAIIANMIRNRRKGKAAVSCGCGCGCGGCPMAGKCSGGAKKS